MSAPSYALEATINDLSGKIQEWCYINNLAINTNKTENINCSLNKSHYDRFVRFLGIHVEPGLGWHNHVNYLSRKITKGLFMLLYSIIYQLNLCL